MITRFENNPIFSPADVTPSFDNWSVEGVYNPGAFKLGDEFCLLVRVIEKPIMEDDNLIGIPIAHVENGAVQFENGKPVMDTKIFRKDDPDVDCATDPRFVYYKGQTYDVIYSHLRLARSRDGQHFTLDERPTFCARHPLANYGIHDPRVIFLDNAWQIMYSGNSSWGTPMFRATTTDWVNFAECGLMFPAENKDVCLFPEKIGGKYLAIHRPAAAYFEGYNMWLASSPDLEYWGELTPLAASRDGHWDSRRIGCGAEPIKTERGWLVLYHGSDGKKYDMGAMLLDIDDPSKVLARSDRPLMEPETDYEKEGFFSEVVFSNGHIQVDDDRLYIYYGGADKYTAGCEISIQDILSSL